MIHRDSFLKKNKESINKIILKNGEDYIVQTILIDYDHMGVKAANKRLSTVEPIEGSWVWILDDDDICIFPNLIQELKKTISHTPIILLKADCTSHKVGIIPSDKNWGRSIVFGDIGMSCFVVKSEIFNKYKSFFPNALGGDFAFISKVFEGEDKKNICWLDIIASKSLQHGKGK